MRKFLKESDALISDSNKSTTDSQPVNDTRTNSDTNSYEWVENSTHNPKDFPLEIFPKEIITIIEMLEKNLSFQPQLTSAGILFAASTAIGGMNHLEFVEGWDASACLWIYTVGYSGSGKTHPVTWTTKPLAKIEHGLFKAYEKDYDDWTKADKKGDQPIRRHILMDTSTMEGITKGLHHNHNGAGVHKDELAGLFKSFNQYKTGGGGEDGEFYLSAFDNKSWSTGRAKAAERFIKSLYVPMIGGIQPDILLGIAAVHTNNGMIPRWLPIEMLTEKPTFTGEGIHAKYTAEYNNFIKNLWELKSRADNAMSYRNMFEPEAKAAAIAGMQRIIDRQYKYEKGSLMFSFMAKLQTYYPRFILVVGNMNGQTRMTPNTVYKADNLVKYFESSAESIFIKMGKNKTVREIIKGNKGKSQKTMIQILFDEIPGIKGIEIASVLGCSKQYVSACRKV